MSRVGLGSGSRSALQQVLDDGVVTGSPALLNALSAQTNADAILDAEAANLAARRSGSGSFISGQRPFPRASLYSNSGTIPASGNSFISGQRPYPRASLYSNSGIVPVPGSPENLSTTSFSASRNAYNGYDAYEGPSLGDKTRGVLRKAVNDALPVSKTADKLQSYVARIPRYVYVIAAVVLIVAFWMWLWQHMLIQFTFGRRRGQKARCDGKPGTTALIQIGGAKPLEHDPNWEIILGSGTPTFIPKKIGAGPVSANINVSATAPGPVMAAQAQAQATAADAADAGKASANGIMRNLGFNN